MKSARSLDVVLLGTGTPVPDPERSGPATAVVTPTVSLLFDAGPGVVRQAAAAADRHHLVQLRPEALRFVFLTHLHSDHTTGLPDLLFGGWVLGRDAPVRVVGPPGTRAMVDGIVAAWSEDVRVRQGVEGLPPSGVQVDVVETTGGEVLDEAGIRVRAFEVDHGTWDHALGYAVQVGTKRVVISGDTAPTAAVVEACDGCDVLVHEVYSQKGYDAVPSDGFHEYHGTFHTSAVELGQLAQRSRPEVLVLTHLLFFGDSEEGLVSEVRGAGFVGEVVVGSDGTRVPVAY